MVAGDSGSSARGPRTRRYPCPWCGSPDAWPDGCSEAVDAGEGVRCCTSMIEKQCMRGDHRRCALGACTVSARWHEPVRAAGIAAAQAAGHGWAVVSTIENNVTVVGTSDHLGRAKLLLRTVLLNAGHQDGPEGRGLVYIVRGLDGGFL